MENIVILILGVLISGLGLVNMTGNISTVHSYNRKRVREEDIPKYGRAVGLGTLIIGLALIADFVLVLFNLALAASLVLIPAIAVGLAFILYAQFKYNHGIF